MYIVTLSHYPAHAHWGLPCAAVKYSVPGVLFPCRLYLMGDNKKITVMSGHDQCSREGERRAEIWECSWRGDSEQEVGELRSVSECWEQSIRKKMFRVLSCEASACCRTCGSQCSWTKDRRVHRAMTRLRSTLDSLKGRWENTGVFSEDLVGPRLCVCKSAVQHRWVPPAAQLDPRDSWRRPRGVAVLELTLWAGSWKCSSQGELMDCDLT